MPTNVLEENSKQMDQHKKRWCWTGNAYSRTVTIWDVIWERINYAECMLLNWFDAIGLSFGEEVMLNGECIFQDRMDDWNREVKELGVGNPCTLKLFQKIQSLSCLWDNGLDMSVPKLESMCTPSSLASLALWIWYELVEMGGKFDVMEGGPKAISLVLVRLTTISFWSAQLSSWWKKDCILEGFVRS